VSDNQIENNELRVLGYMAGILTEQQIDPLCRDCKSFAESAGKVRDAMETADHGRLSSDMKDLYATVTKRMGDLRIPGDPIPQRKVDNCSFPEKVCMIQHALKMLEMLRA
jgi:hypothetical protein